MKTVIRDETRPNDVDAALSDRDVASILYKERRSRDAYMPKARRLWSDPAWDMLLDLFIAYEDGKTVSITSACIGGCLAPTTGLRWISRLIGAGLVRRTTDPSDGRKGMLGVTEEAATSIRSYIDHVRHIRGFGGPSLSAPSSSLVRKVAGGPTPRTSDAAGRFSLTEMPIIGQ